MRSDNQIETDFVKVVFSLMHLVMLIKHFMNQRFGNQLVELWFLDRLARAGAIVFKLRHRRACSFT